MVKRLEELSGVTLDTIRKRLFGWEENRLNKIEAHKLELEHEYLSKNPDVIESRFAPDLSATYRATEPREFDEVV
jgi:hypothetical protein